MIKLSLSGDTIGPPHDKEYPVDPVGLAIINPIYFTCRLIGVMKSIQLNVSIILGAILGPLFYLISPDWCVLIGGFVAGTVAFIIGEKNVS